jgi:hypothetical protein
VRTGAAAELRRGAVLGVERRGALGDGVDAEPVAGLVGQVLERQLAGDVVDDGGREADLLVVGHPGRLEAHVHELRDVRLERHAVLQADRDADRERVEQTGQRRALLAELDEDLAEPVTRVLAGGEVAGRVTDGERDRLRRAGLGQLATGRDVDRLDDRRSGAPRPPSSSFFETDSGCATLQLSR